MAFSTVVCAEELWVGQSKDLVQLEGSPYQTTTSEYTAGRKRLSIHSSDLLRVEISGSAIIKCNYKLYIKVVNKSNFHSKTP